MTEVVRSPGLDQGHDDQSRNVREVKIDILEGYIRTSEGIRVTRVFFGVPESYGNTGRKLWALLGPAGKRRGQPWAAAPPSPLVRIGLGKRGSATFPSSLLPSPFLPSWWTPTRTWSPSRTPHPGRTNCLGRPPPPPSFMYRGKGHPRDTTIDCLIF